MPGFMFRATPFHIPPEVWTPTSLGAALKGWWNADDHGTANMTDAGSGKISAWADRTSGISATDGGTAGRRPTWTANAFNTSYAGVTFDGANTYLHNGSFGALPNGATAGELWFVGTYTGGLAACVPFGYGGTSGATQRAIRVNAQANAAIYDGSTTLSNNKGFAASIVGGFFDGTTMGGRQNGDDFNTATTTIATLNTSTTNLRLGANTPNTPTLLFTGTIRHAIVTTTLTANQRLQMEGWLAWDSGLVDLLPSSHPFKGWPP